jgi:biopolymer transport protein ExbD
MAVKMKRRARLILDMTPMVDIAFLLVIFFMSTYNARPPVTVDVNLPESRSPFKVPEANVMMINVLAPVEAKALAESIGPTNLITLVNNIREASMQPDITVEKLKGMAGTLLPYASQELLTDIVKEPGKPLNRGRAAGLAITEARRHNNFITKMAKQEIAALTPEQMNARMDSLMIWYNTGRDASQPVPMDQVAGTVVEERIRNPRLMMVMMVDKDCLSGKMLDLTKILQKQDVNMLRFSLVTNLKSDAKNVFSGEGR